jgi:two-component system LytT family response regulator
MKVFKIKSPGGPVLKVLISSKCNSQIFALNDIIYCSAERNYTWFHLANGSSCLSSVCLSKVTGMLDNYGFFMVNKSYLINVMHILGFSSGEKYNLKLTNDIEITVSVPKKTILNLLLNE